MPKPRPLPDPMCSVVTATAEALADSAANVEAKRCRGGRGLTVGARPRPLTPQLSARDLFGAELRHWRCLRGLSQAALAQQVFVSSQLIGKIEHATRFPSADVAHRCDQALETGGVLGRLLVLVEAERSRPSPGPSAPADAPNVDSFLRAVISAIAGTVSSRPLAADTPAVEVLPEGVISLNDVRKGRHAGRSYPREQS